MAADAAAKSAEAAKSAAEYRLNERRTIAPVGGRVEEVFFRKGEFVTPGAPILAILPDDGLKVRRPRVNVTLAHIKRVSCSFCLGLIVIMMTFPCVCNRV